MFSSKEQKCTLQSWINRGRIFPFDDDNELKTWLKNIITTLFTKERWCYNAMCKEENQMNEST